MDQSAVAKPLASTQSSIRSFFTNRTTSSYAAPPTGPPPKSSSSSTIDSKPRSTPPPRSSTPRTAAPPPPKSNATTPNSRITPARPLPPQASIQSISADQITPLKRINSLLLEIAYPDSFYHKIQQPASQKHANFSRSITWTESSSETKVIGGCVCRLDFDSETKTSSIYIQSLALLSPYRGMGLATAVLDEVTTAAIESSSSSSTDSPASEEDFPITSLYAHVWSENKEGLEWYAARGFTREEPILQGYYRRLKPDTAWLYRRAITPSDHLRRASSPSAIAATIPKPSSVPPVLKAAPPRPGLAGRSASYQTARPATEWNDLPSDILLPSSRTASKVGTPALRHSPTGSSVNLVAGGVLGDESPNMGSTGGGADDLGDALSQGVGLGLVMGKVGTLRGKKKRVYPSGAFDPAAAAAAAAAEGK